MLFLTLMGALICFIGALLLVVNAFRESALWGICCLVIPFSSWAFAFLHWDQAKIPFFIHVGGLGLMILSRFL